MRAATATLLVLTFCAADSAAQYTGDKKQDPASKPAEKKTADSLVNGKTLDQWIALIPSKDRSLTEMAVDSVYRYGPELAVKAVPAMVAELNKHTALDPIDLSVRVNIPPRLALIISGHPNPDPRMVTDAVTAMRRMLSDTQIVVKFRVAQSLAQMGFLAKDARPELIRVLREGGSTATWELRHAAVMALGSANFDPSPSSVPHKESIDALYEALKDPAYKVRLTALQALEVFRLERFPPMKAVLLSRLNKAASEGAHPSCRLRANMQIYPLLDSVAEKSKRMNTIGKFLEHSDALVRMDAAQGLGQLGEDSRSQLPKLLSALRDKDENVKNWAAWALGCVRDKGALPQLKEIADDTKISQGLRETAQDAISAINGGPPMKKDEIKADSAAQYTGDKKQDPTSKATEKKTADSLVNGKTLDQWIALIPSKDRSLTEMAVDSVYRYGPELAVKAVPAMVAELNKHTAQDPIDLSVRVNIPPRLALIISGHPNPDPRMVTDAVTAMRRMLSDTQIVVKFRVAQSLAQMGFLAKDARPELIRVLREGGSTATWELRHAAVMALGSANFDPSPNSAPDQASIDAIYVALSDPAYKVRLTALQALEVFRLERFLPMKAVLLSRLNKAATEDAHPSCRLRANMQIYPLLDSVAEKSKRMNTIGKFLEHSDALVRMDAAQGLGQLGEDSRSQLPKLLSALRDKDENVKNWAAWALGCVRDKGALPQLKEIADDTKISQGLRETAQDAISAINGGPPMKKDDIKKGGGSR